MCCCGCCLFLLCLQILPWWCSHTMQSGANKGLGSEPTTTCFSFSEAPEPLRTGPSQTSASTRLIPLPWRDPAQGAGGHRLGGLSWPTVPSARPAGLSADPQAAQGRWGRRGLEKATGAHPLPNTPSTRPAPGKGRGGNQRDLDKGWALGRRGQAGGCQQGRQGVHAVQRSPGSFLLHQVALYVNVNVRRALGLRRAGGQ